MSSFFYTITRSLSFCYDQLQEVLINVRNRINIQRTKKNMDELDKSYSQTSDIREPLLYTSDRSTPPPSFDTFYTKRRSGEDFYIECSSPKYLEKKERKDSDPLHKEKYQNNPIYRQAYDYYDYKDKRFYNELEELEQKYDKNINESLI
jgi:hypothetical protein